MTTLITAADEVTFAHVFPATIDHTISTDVIGDGSQLSGEVTIEWRPVEPASRDWEWRHGVHNKIAFVVSFGEHVSNVVQAVTSRGPSSVAVYCGTVALPARLSITRLASHPKDNCPVSIAVTRVSVK